MALDSLTLDSLTGRVVNIRFIFPMILVIIVYMKKNFQFWLESLTIGAGQYFEMHAVPKNEIQCKKEIKYKFLP
jgi:hypothetical protein